MPSINIHIGIMMLGVSLLLGCSEKKTTVRVPIQTVSTHEEVSAALLTLNQNKGLVYHKGIPFTGVSVSTYQNGQIAEKITYVDGERDGYRGKWFDNGQLSYEAMYESNKLIGTIRSWWSNGNLRTAYRFTDGKPHGVQKQWYESGELFKELNMANGKEEGIQQAWRKNGKLYVNYEAKNGRIFGLKRANLCYELNNETIVSND